MDFYSNDGTKICKEKFLRLYEDNYYLRRPRCVPGVSQTSCFVESEIDRLLKNGIKTKLDVVHIMAWKMGKVKQEESRSASRDAGRVKFVYASDWQGAESAPVDDLVVKRYGTNFCVGKLAAYTNIYLKGDTERRGFFVSGKEDAAGNTVCIAKAADAA